MESDNTPGFINPGSGNVTSQMRNCHIPTLGVSETRRTVSKLYEKDNSISTIFSIAVDKLTASKAPPDRAYMYDTKNINKKETLPKADIISSFLILG